MFSGSGDGVSRLSNRLNKQFDWTWNKHRHIFIGTTGKPAESHANANQAKSLQSVIFDGVELISEIVCTYYSTA
jgi:hypothetical protein